MGEIKSELEIEEERRLAKEAEERRKRMKREEMIASRQKGIQEKMHKIRTDKIAAEKRSKLSQRIDTKRSEEQHKGIICDGVQCR